MGVRLVAFNLCYPHSGAKHFRSMHVGNVKISRDVYTIANANLG